MISVKLYGGLANNLFQIATCLATAFKYNESYCIPTEINNPHYDGQKVFYSPNLNYCNQGIVTATIYKEPHFHFTEIPAPKSKFTLLDGYWQSERYFSEYREEILKLFEFNNIQTKEGVCSIHFRATDYHLHPTKHPIISVHYLKESITRMWFNEYRKFLVFSDAIPEIKKIISSIDAFKDLEFEYSEGKTELEDLKEMASCESNITANSSLSWWAVYINPNKSKVVIMPSRWFGKDLLHDTKDLYLPNVIIL